MTMFRSLPAADRGDDAGGRRGAVRLLLNLVWAALFAIGIWATLDKDRPVWVWVVCGVGIAVWVARSAVPDRLPRLQVALELLMIVAGGIVAFSASVLGGVPLAVGIILIVGRPQRPLVLGLAALPIGLAALGAGALLSTRPASETPSLALGCLSTLVIAALVGLSRRQSRTAELRTAELEVERRRTERLDDHARVARELHDVLAHGLGGLVVQLDAVDALLEAGRGAEAAERVRSARDLGVEALRDARRAVDALRSDDAAAPPVPPAELAASLDELVAAHRGLGGEVGARLDAAPGPVSAAVASALRRTLQEALSNARKHAPGEPVTVRLESRSGRLVLEVENPVGGAEAGGVSALARTGGGRGIPGMEERMAELDGGVLEAGARGGVFAVRAEVPA